MTNNIKKTMFEIQALCPLLGIMLLERRTIDFSDAVLAMSDAYKLNGGVNLGNEWNNALAYLQSLQKEENAVIAQRQSK